MKLGTNILKICKEKSWSLTKLAKESGAPLQTIHGWTSGRKAVQLEQLKKVAGVLQVPVHNLAFGEPDPNEYPAEEILKEIFSGDVRVTLHRIEKRKIKT